MQPNCSIPLFILAVCAFLTPYVGAAVNAVTLLTGKVLPGDFEPYNGTVETGISTQYAAPYNNFQGVTRWWAAPNGDGETGELLPLQEARAGPDSGSDDKFRLLLKFRDVHRYVPAGAYITSANLTLTFESWQDEVTVHICFLGKRWDYELGGAEEYTSTGWINAYWDGARSVPWSQPGAAADCAAAYSAYTLFNVTPNGVYGTVSRTVALPPLLVQGWLANGGAANYGLLLRPTTPGYIKYYTSQSSAGMLRRPALSLAWSSSSADVPPPGPQPWRLGLVPREWWVAPAPEGNDDTGTGFPDSPFATLSKAIFEAFPLDIINLKSGVYAGAVELTRPNITLRSAPGGHWAVLAAPRNDPVNAGVVVDIRPTAHGGVLRDLEITGGFYYGIMFFTSWENYGTMEERVAQGAGARDWLITNVRIHDTGSNAVKLVMKAGNVTFSNCEIYNTGARLRTAGNGIDAVQVYDITVQDCYFHDIPGAAVHLAGGTTGARLLRNYVARTTFGFNLGFDTDPEYMDTINNPRLYECIDCTAANNIITAVRMAGVNLWACKGGVVAHNTIWQAQEEAQASILVAALVRADTPDPADPSGATPLTSTCANATVWGNVLVRSPSARPGPLFQIRTAGLDPSSKLVMGHNVYYDQAALSPADGSFVWGLGAMLEDERPLGPSGGGFIGTPRGWADYCAGQLGQGYCDVGSIEADPKLDSSFSPLDCSRVRRRAPAAPPPAATGLFGSPLVTDDFHGRPRPTSESATPYDAGAIQFGASGPVKTLSPAPVPAGLVGKPAPYMGPGLPPVYDRTWPFDYWRDRTCTDIYVDAASGSDKQDHNYESSYRKPFKTVAAAVAASNQCDRILLRGGQVHAGPVGIFTPNLTLMTDPRDAPKRAMLLCTGTGTTPCLRTGEGLYGGAASLTFSNFDVAMASRPGDQSGGGTFAACVFLNEGAGGGSSSYWDYYVTQSGRSARPHTLLQNLGLFNCSSHGIKFSTFIRGVVMEGLYINNTGGAGLEVRGGGDLVLRRSIIANTGGPGVRLGGGARNVLVERNTMWSVAERCILLGSDVTEVEYMDVDWAAYGGSRGAGGGQQQQQQDDWHDCINATVRNNLVFDCQGAGVAFYSARDAVVVQNTFVGVATRMQAGVLLNVSPKDIGPGLEVGPPNINITFKNNIVSLRMPIAPREDPPRTLLVEARVLPGTQPAGGSPLPDNLPAGATCAARRHRNRHRRRLSVSAVAAGADADTVAGGGRAAEQQLRRALLQAPHSSGTSFAAAALNAPGEQGRNADGSCPLFPRDNAWRLDVSSLPVHPLSEQIKRRVGIASVHTDFGGHDRINGHSVPYGIPITYVDSRKTPLVQVDIGPDGYGDESDMNPNAFPFPPDTPVEGTYPGCSDDDCGGDRHILVVDNATCLLYEAWRAMPPAISPTRRWQVDSLARFNLSRNAQPNRRLGWTSADAAGLAILPGLVRYDELVNKGVIDHAIRFTGPNSRPAFSPPASHFAAAGDQSDPQTLPWMGMRVRLAADFNCGGLGSGLARVFCVALQRYGGIFADNGSPTIRTGLCVTHAYCALRMRLGLDACVPERMKHEGRGAGLGAQ